MLTKVNNSIRTLALRTTSRIDLVLYALGFLILLSVMSGCSQVSPPKPASSNQAQTSSGDGVNTVPKNIDQQIKPTDSTTSTTTDTSPKTSTSTETNTSTDTTISTTTNETAQIKITGDAAEKLFSIMKVKLVRDQKNETRAGIHYTCTREMAISSYHCEFLPFDSVVGVFVGKRNFIDGAADQELKSDATVGDLSVQVKLSLGSYMIDQKQAESLFNSLQVKVVTLEADSTFNTGYQKTAPQMNCQKTSLKAAKDQTPQYSCRIDIEWDHGFVRKLN